MREVREHRAFFLSHDFKQEQANEREDEEFFLFSLSLSDEMKPHTDRNEEIEYVFIKVFHRPASLPVL